jgi:rod shape-determining protein MreD
VTRLYFATLLILIAVAQSTILSTTGILGVSPNLVLVLILVWSSRYGIREGVVWAFSAGLMIDVLALDPLGSNGLALIVVAVIGSFAQRPLLQSGVLVAMLMTIAATVSHFIVASFIDTLTGTGYPVLISIRMGLLTAFLNALTVPIMYGLIVLLDRFGVSRVAQA